MNKSADYLKQNKNMINRITQRLSYELKRYKFAFLYDYNRFFSVLNTDLGVDVEIIIKYFPKDIKVITEGKYIIWTFSVGSYQVLSIDNSGKSYNFTDKSIEDIAMDMILYSLDSKTPMWAKWFTYSELERHLGTADEKKIDKPTIKKSGLYKNLCGSLKNLLESKIEIQRNNAIKIMSSVTDKSVFPLMLYDLEKEHYCIGSSGFVENKFSGQKNNKNIILKKDFESVDNNRLLYNSISGIDYTIIHGSTIDVKCDVLKNV